MNATTETSLFNGKKIERAEFLKQAGYMGLLALLSCLLTNEVVNALGQKSDDSWAGDYRGV